MTNGYTDKQNSIFKAFYPHDEPLVISDYNDIINALEQAGWAYTKESVRRAEDFFKERQQ